ncbi:MAG: hypothetical protein EOO54_15835, partial [Haliea sp.]
MHSEHHSTSPSVAAAHRIGATARQLCKILAAGALALSALHMAPAMAAPSDYRAVYRFGAEIEVDGNGGMAPMAPPVLGQDGKLYGMSVTTRRRHTDSNGTPTPVFTDPVSGETVLDYSCIFYRLDPASGAYEKLAEVDSPYTRIESGGYYPTGDRSGFCQAPVQASDGTWYGSTFSGGA